jgi:hypothetical protein
VSGTPPGDLSRATKLKDLSLSFGWLDVQRVTTALQTVQSKHLQQITIHPCGILTKSVEETVLRRWQDLDRLLVQFWTSHSIRPMIKYEVRKGGDAMRAFTPSLLPELTRRGLVGSVED